MIVRIIIILVCVTFFINGCNSLISQFFGTHKLRTYDVETVEKEGVGDSDYINLSSAQLNGDFVYQESEYPNEPGVIIYPVLTKAQVEEKDNGKIVKPSLIAWTADFHAPCVQSQNCIPKGVQSITGVVRDIPDNQLPGLEKLQKQGYEIGAQVTFVNQGEAPLAWYWNGLIMLGAAAIAVGVEAYWSGKKTRNHKTLNRNTKS